MAERIEITLSKKKYKRAANAWLETAVVIVVVTPLLLWWMWDELMAEEMRGLLPAIVVGMSVIAVVFVLLYFNTKRKTRTAAQTVGLVIDDEGILYDDGLNRIWWHEITGFEWLTFTHKRGKEHVAGVMLKDPQEFIARWPLAARRGILSLNRRMYGTPALIFPDMLDISLKDLLNLLEREFDKRHPAFLNEDNPQG